MPLFTAILVMVFGGLTLYLKNDVFIKMKPTVLYGFFGAVLLGGLFFNRLFIKYVFAQAFELNEQGWRKLTVRWGLFFLVLAVINETVWRLHFHGDLGVIQGLGHHPPDFFVRARTDPAGDETSGPGSGRRRKKHARLMRPACVPVFGRRAISLEILRSLEENGAPGHPSYKAIVARAHQSRSRLSSMRAAMEQGGRALQDARRKKCAWTSHHKTVLTPPVGATFLKPEYGT